ncbi:restriction endonuclease subunit S [Candidatus Bathyarchaeota archaeon]|nr:restriction endonuclease subunit S [Candidatus Bathyarchaeota archaeon]
MVKKNTTLDVFMKGNAKAEKQKQETETGGLYPLPEGWKWMRVKNVAKPLGGGTPSKNNPEYWGGTIPWISPKDMQAFEIFYSQDYITEKGLVESATNLIESNSVLIVFRSGILRRKIPIAINRVPVTINQDLKALIPKKAIIIPEFLAYYLKSIENYIITRCVEKGATVHRIISKRFFELAVPVPPLEEQKRIVSRLEQLVSRVEKVKRLRKSAKEETEKIMQVALHEVFSRAEEKWGLTKLTKICKINPSKSEIKHLPDDIQVSFVPMTAVSEISGRIEKPEVRLLGEVRKGYTYFRENDVLFAKITPCMENGKAAIARNLVNGIGFGSTEFHVLRPLGSVLPEWIFYYIRQKSFRDYAAKYMTGSVGQQRVPVQFLKNVKIPLPPIEEQKKMVAYLCSIKETVESLRELQQSTDEELEQLIPAILDKAFKGRL